LVVVAAAGLKVVAESPMVAAAAVVAAAAPSPLEVVGVVALQDLPMELMVPQVCSAPSCVEQSAPLEKSRMQPARIQRRNLGEE
jgi:hypothetical protein